jgi:hypothetical protein
MIQDGILEYYPTEELKEMTTLINLLILTM